MSKYKPQHARLLFIDRKIRENRYPSCLSLAQEWEVTRKTIQRDISYMKYQLDAPIAYIAQQRGYRYTEERYQLPAMEVREGDLFAIYLAEKLLAQYKGTPVHDNLSSVFAKIAQSLPEKVQQPEGQDFSKFTFITEPAARLEAGVWEMVFGCLKKQETLQFAYRSPSVAESTESSFSMRKMDPYHVVRHGSDWYVIGFCHNHDAVRTFNLARMSHARTSGVFFTIPEGFDATVVTDDQFGIYQGETLSWVEVQFSARVAGFIKEKMWHKSQEIKMTESGDLIMRLQVNHRLELQKWVLSWGSDATVLSPESFVTEMRNEVEKMKKKYG